MQFFKEEIEEHPRTFSEELKRQCNRLAVPTMFLAIISWPSFIPLDVQLFPQYPAIIYLRWGFTLIGIISMLLYFTVPFIRNRGYWLVYFISFYLGLASSFIVGLTKGHPSYFGGLAIVILVCSLAPLGRIRALIHLLLMLALFKIVLAVQGVNFEQSSDIYGLFNMLLSVLISIIVIYVFEDIRRNSYEKSRLLKVANEDLQKANELKNQLLQVAAHDLKDPLQVIIGYTDMLQMKLASDKFAAEKLRIIYRSTERMIKLIAGLLEITTIESGKLLIHKGVVDLSEVVESAVKIHQQNSTKKNQKLSCKTEKRSIVFGDAILLRQIANHVIDNAVKFSPPGKSIWITVEKQDNSIEFTVKDEGPGLEQDELKRMFEKFQRLSSKPTGGEISTGLGLAITRDLVEINGGTIFVESEPGKGTIFTIRFPLYQVHIEPFSDEDNP